MLVLNGEPVLHRTVRLCKAAAPDVPIFIVSNEMSVSGCQTIAPDFGLLNTDKFKSSSRLWASTGSTLFIHGDVLFESKDIPIIIAACKDESLWFGNIRFYEVLASYVSEKERDRWLAVMRDTHERECKNECAGGAWRMLRIWNDLPPEGSPGELYPFPNYPEPIQRYVDCPGWSRDFDYPADLAHWLMELGAERIACL